jgi:hypothetical protein
VVEALGPMFLDLPLRGVVEVEDMVPVDAANPQRVEKSKSDGVILSSCYLCQRPIKRNHRPPWWRKRLLLEKRDVVPESSQCGLSSRVMTPEMRIRRCGSQHPTP